MSNDPEGKSLVDLVHQFEVDVECLVTRSRELLLEAITHKEEEEALAHSMSGDASAVVFTIQTVYSGLRRAANNMAIVALVTRLDHTVRKFRKRIPKKASLITNLCVLNNHLGGDSPVSVKFFEELVNVRDSVIHGDSKREWPYNNEQRRVAEHYAPYGELAIEDTDVKEAVARPYSK